MKVLRYSSVVLSLFSLSACNIYLRGCLKNTEIPNINLY